MASQKLFLRAIIGYTLTGILLGGFVETAIAPRPVQAESILEMLRNLISPPTTRGTASGRRRGGAIRGNCSAVSEPAIAVKDLVALIPKSNDGKTTSAFPTFWFYIPTFQFLPSEQSSANQTAVRVREGEFMLLDDRGLPVLKAAIPVKLPDQSGFARFTLPNDPSLWLKSKGLEVGKRYNWFFSVGCDEKQPAKNPSVRGWIARVAPSGLAEQLQKVPANKRYEVYIQNQIWFEGFTLLAEDRQAAPDTWAGTLSDLELSKVAQAPIMVLQVKSGK